MKRYLLLTLALAIAAGTAAATALGATSQLVVTPVADAYVSAAYPSTNYGAATMLRVRSGTNAQTSYFKFSVSGVSGTVTSARLRVYVADASSSGGAVHKVASTTWSESTITWGNAPALSATALVGMGPVSLSQWVAVELGGASVPGNGTYSFAIKGSSTDPAAYTSRETSSKPQLVLTVSSGTAPTNTSPPTISGTASDGSVLTASPGTWTGDPAPTYSYQWRRCDTAGSACVDVTGATASTYKQTYLDVGKTMRVRVKATNEAGSSTADSAQTAVVKPASLAFPIRGAFYYGWYPENWVPGTHYTPSLGWYDSSDTAVIRQHIKSLQYGGVQAGIYSWWGLQNTGNNATARFPTYLKTSEGTGFKWAVYHEPEGYANPTATEIEADLKYIRDNYATSSSYLHVNGKPVVFVYSGVGDGCGMADRWRAGNTTGAHVVLSTSWVDNSPQLASVAPYGDTFTAGVRVAAGDLTGDGKAELVTAPGAGVATQINVFSGAGAQLASFPAGDPASTRGAFVAVGDVTGDGKPEIVVGSGAGTTPRIDVFSYASGTVSHLGTFDPQVANGVRVAVGDVNGDGKGEIVAASGPGTAPAVRAFAADGTLVGAFAPYDSTFTKGLYVASANVTGDGRAEIILGSGNGTRNEVRILDASGALLIPAFEAYPSFGGAISVAAADVTGDGERDIVTGASGGPRVRSFTLRLGRPSGLASFFAADPSTSGQIWVAAADAGGERTADIVTGSAAGQPGRTTVWGNVRDCASQPDGWHEYLITASGESSLGRNSFTVAPGYWWAEDAAPLLPRDPARWDTNVRRMASSGADWQLVLSFSEWGEASSVESAKEWTTTSGHGTYVDTLKGVATGTTSTSSSGSTVTASGSTDATGDETPTVDGGSNGGGENGGGKPVDVSGTAPAAEFPLGHRGRSAPAPNGRAHPRSGPNR